MATQAELAVLRGTATQVKNESQVGGNTAGRVGGLFEGIVDALPSDEVIDGKISEAVNDIQPIVIEGNVDNAPDQEDLTSVNQGGTDVLKFKDKTYSPALFSGLGRVYLRKNIVTLEGTGKNVLTQAMVNTANTIYHIQYDYDLNGQTINIPAGCVLEFDGGSVKNGEIDLNGGVIQGDAKLGVPLLNAGNSSIHLSWFKGVTSDNDAIDNAILSMLASVNESKVLDGDNVALSLSKTIEFGDGKDIILKNLYIEFSASANGQSMFLFNEENNYAGSFALIENCTFVQTNSANYSNVHCLHLRDYSNTTKSKISNVLVKNFSGFMFLCESYLQEMEFEFFKGSIVGGFISFNKEYGTNQQYGDFAKGSSNILTFTQCGIDEGLNANSTIVDVFDVTRMISTILNSVVIQGANNGRTNVNIWNFTQYDNLHNCNVLSSGCWSEVTGMSNYAVLGMGVNLDCSTRFASSFYVKGEFVTINLQLQAIVAANVPRLFVIDANTYPTIKIKDSSNLYYFRNIFTTYRDVANISVDASCSANNVTQLRRLYYREGAAQNIIDYIFKNINRNSTDGYFIYDGEMRILRQIGIAGTGSMAFYQDQSEHPNYILTSPKKRAYFHLIYRVYPRVPVTSENLADFANCGLKNELGCLQGARYNPFVVGQSQVPEENIWREVLTDVYDKITSPQLYGYKRVGLDIVVSEIIDGMQALDSRVRIDPSDATKLIYLKKDETRHSVTKGLPVPSAEMAGLRYFDDTKMLPIIWNGEKWRGNNGYSPAHTFGTTANRPTSELKSSDEGFQYFDITLQKQLFGIVDFNTILISVTAPKRDIVVVNNTMVKGEKYRITTIAHTWNYVDVWLSKNQTVGDTADVRLVRLPAQNAVFIYDFIMQYDASEYPYVIIDSKDGSKDLPVDIYSGNIVWKEIDGAAAGVSRSGTFANKPSSADVYVGFRYFCTDKQTTEGATDGIEIIYKGNDVWVDVLGRVVS